MRQERKTALFFPGAVSMQPDQRLAEEDAQALLPLIRGKVAKFVGRSPRHVHVRRDLVQDAFLRLVSRLPTFNPERGSLAAFAATLVDSVLVDHYRYERCAKRDVRRNACSLNEPVNDEDGDPTELGQTMPCETGHALRGTG